MNPDQIIKHFNLAPHPEGGYFRELYRSEEKLPASTLPERYRDPRTFATSIYFLLKSGEPSLFHKLQSNELFYFHCGSPLTAHCLHKDGEYQKHVLGKTNLHDLCFQIIIPHGTWFAAEVEELNSFSLIGCMVAPGFEFDDFEMGKRADLIEKYPEQRTLIERLTP